MAERAVAQCAGILKVYEQALDAALLMARNADMERNLALGKPPAGSTYISGPQGRQFTKLAEALGESQRILGILETAVAFDPKHPPRS